MNRSTVDYRIPASYPSMSKPRKRSNGLCGCACDGNYAKSLQGICKVISLLVGLLAFIIIGVSPYWRTIFVLEGVTWPFHIVMLITVLVWLATVVMYCFFLSGQQLEYPHIAWPTVELRFNVVIFFVVLFDCILEAANVWRWDMSGGYNQAQIGSNNGAYNGLNSYGFQPGMGLTQSINFNTYCSRYPRDCTDYFQLLTGRNSYFGNHIFATLLLFILLICYAVSSYFSYRTWRVFKRDMSKGKEKPQSHPKPSRWARFRYRMSEIKMPNVTATNIRERFSKMLGRGDPDEGEGHAVDVGVVPSHDIEFDDMSKKSTTRYEKSSTGKRSTHAGSVYSSAQKSHRSHQSSSHHSRRSRSSSGTRKHKDDYDRQSSHHGSSHDDHRSERSHGSRSRNSGSESRSSRRHDDNRSSGKNRERENGSIKKEKMVVDMKEIGREPADGRNGKEQMSPVASVMI